MSDESKVTDEAHWLLYSAFIPHTDEWFTVAQWLDIHNKAKYNWAVENRDVGLLLAAFELLVRTGHLEGGTDEFGARVFRRRISR
jgi:hypothetical protein